MAGLAALLSFGSDRTTTQTLEALSDALAPRGDDFAITEVGAAKLLVRAALPKVSELDGVVIVVDGIAETTSLTSRYQTYGPTGLIAGQHPYALILADPDGLVLARNLDGPPLYYARIRGAVMVASEPVALIKAGVPAAPNDEIVERFLATGACDEVPATFFEGIRRVLPGQVVEIQGHTDASGRSDGWAIRAHPPAPQRSGRVSVRMALLHALGEDRLGVAMISGGHSDGRLPMAALLGAALAERGTHKSMPVYSANFPGLSAGSSSFWSALLGPVPDGALKHRAMPFFADEFDVDGFVEDLGEPAPSLSDYLLWAVAKASGGEVDVLLSSLGHRGATGHLSRLADRLASRYGVGLRFPYRDLGGLDDAMRAELLGLAERTLPPASVRAVTIAGSATSTEPALDEILQRLRAEVAGALLYPRQSEPDHDALARLADLAAAKRPELDRIWRHYVLERWLSTVVTRAMIPASRPTEPRVIEGWQRRGIGVEPLTSGDRYGEKIAWYVAEFVAAADKQTRQALRQPWVVLVAGKAVAVAEGEAHAIWQITPGRLARALVRIAGARTSHPDPWSMQIALGTAGRARMSTAVLCACLGWTNLYRRLTGVAARSVSPPRENGCPPAHLAVIGPPRQPDQSARHILSALRRALPDDIFDTLRGVAIVSADAEGVRRLGWAGKSSVPADLIDRLCADNPMGQADERTPLLIALAAPRKASQGNQRKGGGKQAAKRR